MQENLLKIPGFSVQPNSFSSNTLSRNVWASVHVLLSDYFVSKEVFNSYSQKEKELLFQKLILEFVWSEIEYNLLWESFITGSLALVCWEKEVYLSFPFIQYENYILFLDAVKYHQYQKLVFFKSNHTFH
jgi:hypothetical protein